MILIKAKTENPLLLGRHFRLSLPATWVFESARNELKTFIEPTACTYLSPR
ncbi:MAG: hypothetical protein ACI9GB_002552 [Halioglobus sp.]|jgi:hypothetical protein